MPLESFTDIYVAELQEAWSVEQILCEALPKMADAASDSQLKQAFQAHLGVTETHRDTVEQILRRRGAQSDAHVDEAMQSLVREAEKMIEMVKAGPLRDASLIASAQRIEHYEIALYGTLAAYAEALGLQEDKEALGTILEDEKDTDEELSEIAAGSVNPSAVQGA